MRFLAIIKVHIDIFNDTNPLQSSKSGVFKKKITEA